MTSRISVLYQRIFIQIVRRMMIFVFIRLSILFKFRKNQKTIINAFAVDSISNSVFENNLSKYCAIKNIYFQIFYGHVIE